MRKIDIYGTIGPSSYKTETIKQLFELGMIGIRLNLSHVDLDECEMWLDNFHTAAKMAGVEPKLLIDMKGPELRVKKLEKDILLKTEDVVEISSLGLPSIVLPYLTKGQEVLLDDGKLSLQMISEDKALVLRGGLLKSSKSIALVNCEVKTPTLTESDIKNLSLASKYGVTGIMQPFVRNEEDLKTVRKVMNENGLHDCKLFAKIENQSGVDQLENLIDYCDEIIIARGDLGNAVGLSNLPSVQKHIEKICKKKNKPYMVVTEMLHSMHANPVPTRAEVSDIYHAVYHGANSIMLTGETAAGKYPVEAMRYFVETANTALKDKED